MKLNKHIAKPSFWAANFLTPALCIGLFWLLIGQYTSRLAAAEAKADSVSKVVEDIKLGQVKTEAMLTALLMKQGIIVTQQPVVSADSSKAARQPVIIYQSKHAKGGVVRVSGDTVFIPWDSLSSAAGHIKDSVTPR